MKIEGFGFAGDWHGSKIPCPGFRTKKPSERPSGLPVPPVTKRAPSCIDRCRVHGVGFGVAGEHFSV